MHRLQRSATMHRLLELAVIPAVLLSMTACQSPSPSPTPGEGPGPVEAPAPAEAPAAEAPPGKHGMEPPMTFTLSGPESVSAGQTLTLVAEIRRTFLSPVPMHIDLAVPSGVVIVEGKASETLVDTDQRLLTRTWVLRLGEVPAEDLEVKVAWQADTWGASAVRAYRFGRPEPKLVTPERDGPELAPAGLRPGRGIRVTPIEGGMAPEPSKP